MIKRRVLNRRGVTLVELLVVMAMMGFVATAMFSVYSSTGRSSRTEDEVVELQQILRTAVDQIAADIRMAGFVVLGEAAPFALASPANSFTGAAIANPYPAGAAPLDTMHILMRTASAQSRVIRINHDSPAVGGLTRTFTNIPAEQLQPFTGAFSARIYRAATSNQPIVAQFSAVPNAGAGTITLTQTATAGTNTNEIDFKRGDLIAQTYSWAGADPWPEYVAYSTLPVATMPFRAAGAAGPALDAAISIVRFTGTCTQKRCFPHTQGGTGFVNTGGQAASLIGTQAVINNDINIPRVTRLTFSYLLIDGSEVTSVADTSRGVLNISPLRYISAVRVRISGQTPSGKRRELSTVVRVLNRTYEPEEI